MIVAIAEIEGVAGRVLADAELLASLRKRDGAIPLRRNGHGTSETCPYTQFYNDGDCPWCYQARSNHYEGQRSSHLRRRRAA